MDTSVPYPDAKVCASLCIGRAIRYEIQKGSGVDDAWILRNVCRKRKRQNDELQTVLSQLSVRWKRNEVLTEELSIMKTHLSKKLEYMADTLN